MIISKKKLLSILGAIAAAIAAVTAVLTGEVGSDKAVRPLKIDPKVCPAPDLHECEIGNQTYYRVD